MRRCSWDFKIPKELYGEDVVDMICIFDNEEEALDYITKECDRDKYTFSEELHEYDSMREEFGKKNYLRSAVADKSRSLILNELMSGEYILWIV